MITVAGLTPSVDLTYVVDHFELGRIHRPTEVVRRAGGKPLNLARAAAALGADVSIVAVLGGWTGDWLADELARARIAVHRVTTPVLTRTCVSISPADVDELTELYEYAEPIPADVWAQAREALISELEQRRGWLVISGGPPRGLPPTGLAELAELAHHAGCRVAADTHGASLVPLLHSHPELVKINRSEAAAALGVDPAIDLIEMAKHLQEKTGGVVVLTDGGAGSRGLGTDGRAYAVGAPSQRGRFPVGSGDSYLAGLLTALDRGDDLGSALRLAAAAAAANAQVPGPGSFDSDQVDRLRHDVVVETR
ncbi:MAG TPA: PfkB family carbohydrate kinase [Microlunatus sp.]|nr:PfkB family carbohydrate kinase [Microlunatus sp.]